MNVKTFPFMEVPRHVPVSRAADEADGDQGEPEELE